MFSFVESHFVESISGFFDNLGEFVEFCRKLLRTVEFCFCRLSAAGSGILSIKIEKNRFTFFDKRCQILPLKSRQCRIVKSWGILSKNDYDCSHFMNPQDTTPSTKNHPKTTLTNTNPYPNIDNISFSLPYVYIISYNFIFYNIYLLFLRGRTPFFMLICRQLF